MSKNVISSVCRFLLLVIFVMSSAECNADGGIDMGGVYLKMARPFVTTQEIMRVTFVVSNGLHKAITFFEVGEDGFGCDIEKWEGGRWRESGVTWCATGRKLKTLASGATYEFDVRCEAVRGQKRVALEYWAGEPLVTAPKTVFSERFSEGPDRKDAVGEDGG